MDTHVTITAPNILRFAHATGDKNKIHTTPRAAFALGIGAPEGEVISHGLYALYSNVLPTIAQLAPGAQVAGIEQLSFKAPVFSNDSISAHHELAQDAAPGLSRLNTSIQVPRRQKDGTMAPKEATTGTILLRNEVPAMPELPEDAPRSITAMRCLADVAGHPAQKKPGIIPEIGQYFIRHVNVRPEKVNQFLQLVAPQHTEQISPQTAKALMAHAGSVPVSTVYNLTGLGTLYSAINRLQFVHPIQGNRVAVMTRIADIQPVKRIDKVTQQPTDETLYTKYKLVSYGYDEKTQNLVMASEDTMILMESVLAERRQDAQTPQTK